MNGFTVGSFVKDERMNNSKRFYVSKVCIVIEVHYVFMYLVQ